MTVVTLVEEFVEGGAKIELIKRPFLKIHNYFDSLGMFRTSFDTLNFVKY